MILRRVSLPCSQWKLPPGYPHRISTPSVRAISSQSSSRRTAASAIPSRHKKNAHSPQAATWGCFPLAAFFAALRRELAVSRNCTGSGKSLTINVDRVSTTSNGIYLPWSRAAATSNPSASNRSKRASRCDWVATTTTASPTLRAAPIKRVNLCTKALSLEYN